MTKPEKLLRGMVGAWEMLIDFPLPDGFVRKFGGRVDATSKLEGFPLVGVAIGLLLAFAAAFCALVFKPLAGCVIFAILATAFLDLKDSGRGLALLTCGLLLRQRGVPLRESLPGLTGDWSRIGNPLAAVFVSLLEVGKAALLFALAFSGAKLWIVVILAGAFTVQGMLALDPDRESGIPLLPVPQENRRRGWWIAGIIGLVLLAFFPFGVIVAGAAVYFASTGFAGFFLRNFNGVSPDLITLAGALTELLLLIVGVLFAL